MILPSDWMPCLELAALLALEVTLVVGLATAAARLIRGVLWQRAVWQAATLALLWLTVFESTGVSRNIAHWTRSRLPARPKTTMLSTVVSIKAVELAGPRRQVTEEFRRRVARRMANGSGSESVTRHDAAARAEELVEPFFQGPSLPWLEMIWAAGIVAALGPTCLARLFFLVFGRRQRATFDGALLQRVASLARRLGVRRRVRVVESARLRGPVAFGIFWPTIGLPKDFTTRFSEAQQEVMLAHELAHVAGRDPAWQLLADGVASLLWWHPLGWWARHQLRKSAEIAADEACLLLRDGPGLLAECLLQLASGAGRQPLGSFGATGPFRSGLGRRIEKLVNLRGRSWSPLSRIHAGIMKSVVPLVLVLAAVLGTTWAAPQTKGDPMHTLKNTWRRSIATVALFAASTAEPLFDLKASPAPPGSGSSSPAFSSPAGAPVAQVNAQSLIQDARLLLELGKLEEAEAKLKEADRRNPPDRKVLLDLSSRIKEARLKEPGEKAQVDQAPVTKPAEEPITEEQTDSGSLYRMDPQLMERYGLKPHGRGPLPRASANTARTRSGRQQIENKLNLTTMNEVKWDGLPLVEVVKYLEEASHQPDPSKPGINFLITNVPELPAAGTSGIDPTTGVPVFQGRFGHNSFSGVDPATGMPIAAQPQDISTVLIRLHLRDVRLKDVLDAVTRVADQPIAYSVEDYGVVFSPATGQVANVVPPANRSPEPPRLQVRTFRVDTNTFVAGLESAFGILVGPESDRSNEKQLNQQVTEFKAMLNSVKSGQGDEKDRQESLKASISQLDDRLKAAQAKQAGKGSPTRDIQNALRQLLQQLGINMDVPGKAVFYNELTGIVMVRGTSDDLELMQAAIETLGGRIFRQGVSAVSKSVNLFGKVNRPGPIEVSAEERLSLLDAIARAEGFSPEANKNKIELSRDGATTLFKFDELKKADQQVWLRPGDLVVVHQSFF